MLKNFISPFPKTSPWYLCAVFCCIFIFISFPVYKMAVIGAANQGCLDSKHAATRRWALCDPGTAMLIFLHGKDHFSAKLNHDFLQQRRELLPQKKTNKKPADCNQDTSSQYITAYWNIPCIYFTICLSSLILGCAALLNYMFKANQSKKEERGDWKHTGGFSFCKTILKNEARRYARSQRRPEFPCQLDLEGKKPKCDGCVFHF